MRQAEAILDALPDNIIACDQDEKIVRINAAARKHFLQRYQRDDEQQRPSFPEQWLMNLVMDEEAASSSPEHTLLLQVPSGRKVYATLWCVPIYDAQQHLRETIYVFLDITHRYHKAFHLQRVWEALLSMNEAIGHLAECGDLVFPEETLLLSPLVVFVAQRLVDVIRHVLDYLRVPLLAVRYPTGDIYYIAGSGLTNEQEQRFRKIGEMGILLSALLDETVLARLHANQEVMLTSDHLRSSPAHFTAFGLENLLLVPPISATALCWDACHRQGRG